MIIYECVVQQGFNYDDGRPDISVQTAIFKDKNEALQWLKDIYNELVDYGSNLEDKDFDEEEMTFDIYADDESQEHHGQVKTYEL